jgi:hypothetical protein
MKAKRTTLPRSEESPMRTSIGIGRRIGRRSERRSFMFMQQNGPIAMM